MLHVILLILKIIGITLLVILGLILLVILLILFVPVRYRGETRFKKYYEDNNPDEATENGNEPEAVVGPGETKSYDLYALARITWLLHIVSFAFNYTDGMGYRLKLFGITVLRGGNQEKQASEQDKKDGKEKKKEKDKDKDKKEGGENAGDTVTGKEEDKTGAAAPEPDVGKSEETVTESDKDKVEETAPEPDAGKSEETAQGTDTGKNEETAQGTDAGREQDEKTDTHNTPDTVSVQDAHDTGNTGDIKDESPEEKSDEDKSEKQSVVEKIKKYYNDFTSIINDKRVNRAYELVKVQFVKLLMAIRPRKISGYARYGFDNPAVTGYITAFLAANYSRVRDLEIDPHFEDEILEGELKLKGRIFMFTMVRIGIKVYFNKNVKYTIKRLKELKQEGE